MNLRTRLVTIAFVAASVAIAGCATNGTADSPAAATGGMNAPAAVPFDISSLKIAGQYVGKIHDSQHGRGTVVAMFAQSGANVGGTYTPRFNASPSAGSEAAVVLAATGSNSLRGISVANAGSGACTFRMKGVYLTSTYHLRGSYAAIHGCAGETGTYWLKEQCYFVTQSGTSSAERRPQIMGIRPC